jgi:SAM-dependent methyltransferase
MNAQIEEHLGTLSTENLHAAEISGKHFAGRAWNQYASLSYPEFDICADGPPSDRYDLIFCEQVLEHVWEPQKAIRNLFTMLRPGGTLLVSTPFLIKIHRCPEDYWRFTPECMQRMLVEAGFSVRDIHSWGNKRVVHAGLAKGRWPKFRPFRTLRNEADLPVMVWAYAQKPLTSAST